MNQETGILDTAKEAALAAGRILTRSFRKIEGRQVGLKGMGDYVTDLDHESEETIISVIKKSFPHHRIHAEESGKDRSDSDFTWVIDPLDGTANYVQGIPIYGVSIALMTREEINTGVISTLSSRHS